MLEYPLGSASPNLLPALLWRISSPRETNPDYAADGRRIAYVVTESSDCGVVTNSVTTYDLLGRVVSVETPLGVTSNIYDGTTSRLLSVVYTAGFVHRETLHLYNDLGEQIGTVLDGVTNRTDVAYEQLSNVWWKVTREATVGPSTNALTMVREQLTGLGGGLLSRIVTWTQGGPSTVTERTHDVETGVVTETTSSSVASPVVSESFCGLETKRTTDCEDRLSSYDAFGRCIGRARCPQRAETQIPLESYVYNPVGDLVEKHTFTNGTDVVTETYDYDVLGNRVATTDALGNTIHKAYDPFGNVLADWGATYPVRYEYDTAGRRILLATTRDGTIWDETRWTYDAPTGLCTSKTYADGSVVYYTYTPDQLPLRTTYASGRWIENVYDARRQIVGTLSSDGENDSALQRDAYGRETSVMNGNASYVYALDRCGIATNGTATIGGITRTLHRTIDDQGRLASFGMDDGYATQTINYRADGRIGSISNVDVVVNYSYSDDGYDLGYSLALAGGSIFTRTLTRDPYRRDLVLNISNSVGEDFVYTYDALLRPVTRNVDTFAYNSRSEVIGATICGNHEEHDYDSIGNSIYAAYSDVTNTYAANNLNQYSSISILRDSAPPRETNPSYDADGNLLSFGPWAYTYDSASRLVSVSSNGILLVTNFYDARGRRVKKVTQTGTFTFFYDDWNLVEERAAYTNGTVSTLHYYWGKDVSGTQQSAGGVGGLLYLTIDGTIYIPCYDNNGNVMRYIDANGNIVASYTYDAFGRTISQSGPLAEVFRHRFSTKYFDVETGLYYYGRRFYSPVFRRWINRDPIEEDGGLNLYIFCENRTISLFDKLGLSCKVGTYNVLRLDTWEKPLANGLASSPNLFRHGSELMSSIGTLGNLISLSSLSPSSLANFQAFVDAMVGEGVTPKADALARLRELYNRLRSGPLIVYGTLEYEVCVCKGKKTVFERQDDITDQSDEIWDGNDRKAIQKARQTVLKDMIGKMYSKIKELKRK